MHFVITGSTGFIGRWIAAEACNSGHRVTALLRKDSDRSQLAMYPSIACLNYLDLAEPTLARTLKADAPEVFVHAGWKGVGNGDHNQPFQIEENVPMTIKAVALAAQIGCRHWIGLGSQAEYGISNCRITESHPANPETLYGKAKLASGELASGLCESHGIAASWVRVFSTYGPGDSPRWIIPYVVRSLLNGSAPDLSPCGQLWDFLHVRDAAKAIVSIAETQAEGTYNLGSGSAPELKETIETIRRLCLSEITPNFGAIPYRSRQIMHLEADISKLTSRTGWKPQISIEDGIQSVIDFERKSMNPK
jgi:UDP-glucose 4-epimerase